jgi:hypothetical protein
MKLFRRTSELRQRLHVHHRVLVRPAAELSYAHATISNFGRITHMTHLRLYLFVLAKINHGSVVKPSSSLRSLRHIISSSQSHCRSRRR